MTPTIKTPAPPISQGIADPLDFLLEPVRRIVCDGLPGLRAEPVIRDGPALLGTGRLLGPPADELSLIGGMRVSRIVG
jgi:hypothetical protein